MNRSVDGSAGEDRLSDARREALKDLFERGLDLPADARRAFAQKACGEDAYLYDELISLLESHIAAPAFFDRVAEDVLTGAFLSLSEQSIPAGQTIGRYEIIERLASGGMGVVYRARDSTLGRTVALKVLPAHLTADPGARARLMTEARAASALDHPNIGVVFEAGEVRSEAGDDGTGRLFIAMAWYPGDTLRQKIDRGRFTIREALDCAAQIADGLARAHEAGIIHRDIKPANVIVTERDGIRIVDFGIAQTANPDLTRDDVIRGSVAYMSPEQTRGGLVDHRSDIWSLGVVLYEMLAGRRPFRGDTDGALIQAIRHDEPAPIQTYRPDTPANVARLIHRCLAKAPGRRYTTASSLYTELQSASVKAADSDAQRSIVVLPFVNFSPDPDNEYFSDGLTEEVIADLSKVGALRVISRTSAMRLKNTDADVRTIAADLGVQYALEGGVRKAARALRVTVRLIDALYDDQLWTGKFDGTVDDIFEIQEKVARAVVDALRIELSPREARALADRGIADARAYESYLRARFETWRFSTDGLERATRYIEAALAMTGDNDVLYGALGHISLMKAETAADTEDVDRVDELAEKVFSLNPYSAHGYWLKAWVNFNRGNLRHAIDAGERALALEPDNPDVLLLLGYVYAHAGRNADAESTLGRALDLDPLTPLTQGVQGFVPVLEGRFADAVEPYRRCFEMDPQSPFASVFRGWSLAYNRQIEEAVAALEDAGDRFSGTAFGSYGRSLASALRGDRKAAVEAITPEFERGASRSEMFARELAHCYALAGENERALDWLEHAVDLGMLNYPYLAEHDWFLDGIRDEPRFGALMGRVRRSSAELVGAS